MRRWFAILLLLASCPGCMIFDDFSDFGPPQQAGSCGMRAPTIQQTAEPPLR